MNNLLFAFALLLIVGFTMYESYLFLFINETNEQCNNFYDTCAEAIIREAATSNVITLSTVSIKYKVQIKNFWVTSAIPNKLTKIVFIANDDETFNFCKTFSKYVFKGKIKLNQTGDPRFLNSDFVKITMSRLEIIHRLLSFGLHVFITDLDIYFYKDPIPVLLDYKEDIVTSVDRPGVINAGFYMIKSNEITIKFYLHLITKAKVINTEHLLEQSYILAEYKSNFTKIMSLKELPLSQFPSGCAHYTDNSNPSFYDEIDKKSEYVILHFNCISTSFADKIIKQKDMLMFYVDDNNYYSSTTNKYLKLNFDKNSSDINYDRKVMMFGFSVSIKTNRILILPKFDCSKSLFLKKFTNKNCSYDDLFDMKTLDKYLVNNYRENQFLYNKLVPDAIKTSQNTISVEKVKSLDEVVTLVSKDESKVVILNIGNLDCDFTVDNKEIENGVMIRKDW